MNTRLRAFLHRLCFTVGTAWLLTALPSPVDSVSLPFKNGMVIVGTVLLLGKLLYDTLFFDHYHR